MHSRQQQLPRPGSGLEVALLGLLKGLWKGTVPALLRELIEAWSTALLGVLLAWLTVETLLFSQRARRLRGLLA